VGTELDIPSTPGLEVCRFGHGKRRRKARKQVAVALAFGHTCLMPALQRRVYCQHALGEEAPVGQGIFVVVRQNWTRRQQIQAVILLVVVNVAFIYFIFFLSDPITEWLLDILGLAD
jgi:hypothetical protein